MQERRLRDCAYRKAVFISNATNWQKYRHKRNTYCKMLKWKKSLCVQKKLNAASGNSKETWKILKEILKGKTKSDIKNVEINGVKETEANRIAEGMNEYFVNSIIDINQSIPPGVNASQNVNINNQNCEFKFNSVTEDEVKEILCEMKNKRDVNHINPKVLIDVWPVIGTYFVDIINESLLSGVFPDP